MKRITHTSYFPIVCLLVLSFPVLANDKPWLIPKDVRFRPDGKVTITSKYGHNEYEDEWAKRERLWDGKSYIPMAIETGTYNGVKYRIWFEDGSASFAGTPDSTMIIGEEISKNWDIACARDAI